MISSQRDGRNSRELDGSMPLAEAVGIVMHERMRTLFGLLKSVRDDHVDPRHIHQLRVATRRAVAALDATGSIATPPTWKKIRKSLKRLRRAAGETRQCDVHVQMIDELIESASGAQRDVLSEIRRRIRRLRRASEKTLAREIRQCSVKRLRRLHESFTEEIQNSQPVSLGDAASMELQRLAAAFCTGIAADLSDLQNLHDLRVAGKRLRYALELFGPCLGVSNEIAKSLQDFQDRLGEINDAAELAMRVEDLARDLGSDRASDTRRHASLIELLWRRERSLHEAFITHRQTGTWTDLVNQISDLQCPPTSSPPVPAGARIFKATALPASESAPGNQEAGSSSTAPVRRIAAIDVGTNSIRLVIADVSPDGDFRIIDDEKAMTRLGRGLSRKRCLSVSAMQETAQVAAQFKAIADGHHVDAVRAVATCAVREAANGRDFVAMVEQVAGVPLEIISSHDEARLAFSSVSRAFDLRPLRTAVVDIGGGSTEIVMASGNLIEQIYALPLGAVRLTEQFGIGESVSIEQYREMRKYIQKTLRAKASKPPFVPHLLIGTGGTFTSLASMSAHRGANVEGDDYLPFSIRGYELQRSELKHILDQLRKLPMEGRLHVPGLSPDRSDIIVAGLTVIDCMLKHLQVNTIRVHDQGIRAGLLYSMIDAIVPARTPGPRPTLDRMRAVRQFAAACNYEQQHADHVARIALQLFDQLASGLGHHAAEWATAESRELLHAAAIVHDVGYFINYSKHHKHTYHLVMHSDLGAFTQRQRELIANIARYHRGSRPRKQHSNFARLSRSDRSIVRTMASILRLAVGLDRSHMHSVQSVSLHCQEGVATIMIAAERDVSVDIWGAMRKAPMFEKVFGLKLHIECGSPPEPTADDATAEVPAMRQAEAASPNGTHLSHPAPSVVENS